MRKEACPLNPGTPFPLGVSKRWNVRPVTFTVEDWRAHEAKDRQREQQNKLLRNQVMSLSERIHALEGRAPPPPEWGRANVVERPEEERKKRGAVEGLEALHPPPLRRGSTRPRRCASRAVLDAGGTGRSLRHRGTRGRGDRSRPRAGDEVSDRSEAMRSVSEGLTGAPRARGSSSPVTVRLWESLPHRLLVAPGPYHLGAEGSLSDQLRPDGEHGEDRRDDPPFGGDVRASLRGDSRGGAQREERAFRLDGLGVDGVNHHLWDFLSPEAKAAYFTVTRSGGHAVPERLLEKRRKDRLLECDGGTAFNGPSGRKQRCGVHLLRHARRGLERWETISDAPDWRGLRVIEKIARGVLAARRLPEGEAKRTEARRLRADLARWLKVERHGEAAQSLQKVLTKHAEEVWWWAEVGLAAHNNLAEQGLRPHIAKKRKLSSGSRTIGGAERFAAPASLGQTGRVPRVGIRELGARVLNGQPDPFGSDAGPPH